MINYSKLISFLIGLKEYKEGRPIAVKQRKLNYRFHNPNPADVTADYILKILIEANAPKVERAIKEAALTSITVIN